MKYIALIYAVASLITFIVYGFDKRRARTGGSRVPEASLHTLELFFGWPGAFAAQQVFRHKTKKVSFRIVYWGIVILHLGLWAGWFWMKSE
ncbi:MAG: uncharacterized membrane protein YsdA (DUF1294 family) [Planctomycetota bacterium]|jgi:uncharacterized membrane protein YsdA (DUF1294 family)